MTTPPDLALARRTVGTWIASGKMPGVSDCDGLIEAIEKALTLSRTAGRAEGLKEGATAADSCGETRAAQGRESNTEYHFAAAGALKALATHLRALASDPAPDPRLGVEHSGCNYLAPIDGICNKCGWVGPNFPKKSDPAPGDQVAPGEELRRTITSAIATAIRDGDMKPGAAIGVAMSALAGCTEAVHGDNADIEMCRAYLRHRESTAAPAHPLEDQG